MNDAARIRDLRSRLGLTQKNAAAEVGVEPNTLARWERGEARVPAAAMRLLGLLVERSGRATVSGGARGTTLDPLHEDIRARLGGQLDPGAFEACACDLLRESWPTLVHVGGSGDGGLDGVTGGAEDARVQLIVTTAADVRRNLRQSLKAAGKRPDHPAQAILATSRAITPKLRADLVNDAKALGVRLLQVYPQEWFALELYRRPTWRKRLLALTGRPRALGVVPRAPRRVYGDEVIGRTSELGQLRDASQDALVVGGPGFGKTFLLRVLAGEGRALFLNDNDRSAIADAVRESMPSTIIVDDAHLAEEGIASLMQLRQEIGVSFVILAATWPNYEKRVARVLDADASARIELPHMIADEIVDVVRAVGLQGPDWLIQSIVIQAEGRPGLAATLAHLCLAGSGRRVWSGEALADHLDPVLEEIAGGSAVAVLAPFALGGSKGTSIEDAARFLDRSQSEVREALSRMAPAGVIRTDAARGVAVTPESLRWIVVRNMFFGRGLMDESRLPWEATDTEERTETLIGAASRGAVVPGLRQLVEHVDRVGVWKQYAALGEEAAEHALAARPQLVRKFASSTLRLIPRRTIDLLLDQAGSESGGERPEVVKFVDDLLEDFNPRIEPVILVRRAVALAAKGRLEAGRSPLTSAGTLACSLRPGFESKRTQPGSGRTLTITFGVLSDVDLQALGDIWDNVVPTLLQQTSLPWDELIRLIDAWRVAPGLTLADGTREIMLDLARKMLTGLWAVGATIPGVARRLSEIGGLLGIELSAEESDELATLFPRARLGTDEKESARVLERIRAMAAKWIERDDEVNAAALAALERQAAAGGIRWPRLTYVLGAELAAIHSNPPGLADAFMDVGVSTDVVEQVLWSCVKSSDTDALERALEIDDYVVDATAIVLQMSEPPPGLLTLALSKAARNAENVDTLCMLRKVPDATVARLLGVKDRHVARAAAIGAWNAQDKGVIVSELVEAWTNVVLQSADLDTEFRRHEEYWLGEILELDSNLALAWLRRLDLDQAEHGYSRYGLRQIAKKAIEALDDPDRLALIRAMRHDGPLASLGKHLVGSDPDRYAAMLAQDEHAGHGQDPLRGHPTEAWAGLALVALDRGSEPADLARFALSGFHEWSGSESETLSEWLLEFRALLEHSDPRIVEVARAGERILVPRIQECEEQERQEKIRGL